jgi:hypothetical protein
MVHRLCYLFVVWSVLSLTTHIWSMTSSLYNDTAVYRLTVEQHMPPDYYLIFQWGWKKLLTDIASRQGETPDLFRLSCATSDIIFNLLKVEVEECVWKQPTTISYPQAFLTSSLYNDTAVYRLTVEQHMPPDYYLIFMVHWLCYIFVIWSDYQ